MTDSSNNGPDQATKNLLSARLRDSYDYQQPKTVDVQGKQFVLHPRVFNPVAGNSTANMLAGMKVIPGTRILDMGCGCGVLGIMALHGGAASAVLVDKFPEATDNARENVRLHGFEDRCEVLTSDLFSALTDQRFDVIYFNAPFLYLDQAAATEISTKAAASAPDIAAYGDVGYRILSGFFQGAPNHLAEGGAIQCTFASYGNQALLDQLLEQGGLVKRELRRQAKPDGGARLVYEITRAS